MSAAARTFGGTVSLTKANVAQLLQYRVVLLLYGLRQVLNPLLYMAVWWAVADDGDVAGFSQGDVAVYYIVFMGVAHFTWATGFGQLANLIRLGRLSPHLMRPMNPIWVALFVPSVVLAASLSFVAGVCLGLTAFWVTKPGPFFNVWYTTWLSLSAARSPRWRSFPGRSRRWR